MNTTSNDWMSMSDDHANALRVRQAWEEDPTGFAHRTADLIQELSEHLQYPGGKSIMVGIAMTVRDLAERSAALERAEEVLEQARKHIDGEIDVVDGDYGEPRPNAAMRLAAEIDAVLSDSVRTHARTALEVKP